MATINCYYTCYDENGQDISSGSYTLTPGYYFTPSLHAPTLQGYTYQSSIPSGQTLVPETATSFNVTYYYESDSPPPLTYSISIYNGTSTGQGQNIGVNNIEVYLPMLGETRNVPYGQDYSARGFQGNAIFTASLDRGYRFYRWVYVVNGTTSYNYSNPLTYTQGFDIQIRAESEEIPITEYFAKLEYYSDGTLVYEDSQSESAKDEYADVSFTITDIQLFKPDYVFMGWATYPDAEEPEYTDGDLYTIRSYSISSSSPETEQLYAVWSQNIYYARLEYDAGDGSSPPPAQDLQRGSELPPLVNFTVSTQEPIPLQGYEFLNWRCTEDGQIYEGGETIYFTVTSQDEESPTTRHLVAQYRANGSLYLYTDIGATERRFLIGIPYTYNGLTWEPYVAYIEYINRFVQGTP